MGYGDAPFLNHHTGETQYPTIIDWDKETSKKSLRTKMSEEELALLHNEIEDHKKYMVDKVSSFPIHLLVKHYPHLLNSDKSINIDKLKDMSNDGMSLQFIINHINNILDINQNGL